MQLRCIEPQQVAALGLPQRRRVAPLQLVEVHRAATGLQRPDEAPDERQLRVVDTDVDAQLRRAGVAAGLGLAQQIVACEVGGVLEEAGT